MTDDKVTKRIRDWDPQEGDVFCWDNFNYQYTTGKRPEMVGNGWAYRLNGHGWLRDEVVVSLVSRANSTPRTFGELTDAEKGALLLAKHDGKRVEFFCNPTNEWVVSGGKLNDLVSYRIAPTRINGSVETDSDGKPMFDTWEADQ